MGSFLSNQRNGTRDLYKRNRYYDPTSGRFTQEDPIGLAGGLNLYGFANGDPINFSDPFGLCVFPRSSESCFQLLANWGARTGRGWAVNLGAFLEAGSSAVEAGLVGGDCGDYSCGTAFLGAPKPVPPVAAGPVSAGTRLSMQLASEEALVAAQAGRGTAIAGAGARAGRQIDDIGRLTTTYGGEAAGGPRCQSAVR
jgi:RHS repeat-associated protein